MIFEHYRELDRKGRQGVVCDHAGGREAGSGKGRARTGGTGSAGGREDCAFPVTAAA
jgi:hypothetical protein